MQTFAGKGTDTPISVALKLENNYSIKADKWKKVRGTAIIKVNGRNRRAEIHWYEAYEYALNRFERHYNIKWEVRR